MAYMASDGRGPYPNKAGEWCGNRDPNAWTNLKRLSFFHIKDREPEDPSVPPAGKRFGRPRPCPAGTTEELEAEGEVGVYLLEDRPLCDGQTEVPTPECLKEPE